MAELASVASLAELTLVAAVAELPLVAAVTEMTPRSGCCGGWAGLG